MPLVAGLMQGAADRGYALPAARETGPHRGCCVRTPLGKSGPILLHTCWSLSGARHRVVSKAFQTVSLGFSVNRGNPLT
jgi:hypothetical protein